ncbi:MAG: AAA family ATPase [Candidatus Taylorbacteria bacterium]|nr:AAA family ATPase [Candidatus Taylorbacteria bacterium]
MQEVLDVLKNAGKNVFVTGRAGTGKSTLLRKFMEHTEKNVIVLAPTGVAALNVGGQTIHSFFKFKPGVTLVDVKKISEEKLAKLYQKVDTIIIDEISMVRADLFDCMEKFMRLNGKKEGEYFGGVQIILFGDLLQLPPVVTRDEYHIFSTRYQSPYFFDAKSFYAGSFEVIELTKVYRQQDEDFISVLDKIRTGDADFDHVEYINARCFTGPREKPETGIEFEEVTISYDVPQKRKKNARKKGEVSVHLVTTNAMTDSMNMRELSNLKTEQRVYKATTAGRFDVKNAPTFPELPLRIGAQVMAIRNNMEGKWVNGDMGFVIGLSPDSVKVRFENGKVYDLERETWEMHQYQYDEDSDHIESEVTGTFTQIPLKLAWAVTIHKSQGKTFDTAVIDFGKGAFAHGQAYVALSRVRSLEGITLKTPLSLKDIQIDQRVKDFLVSQGL